MRILIVYDQDDDNDLAEAVACVHFIEQAFRTNDAVLIFNETEIDIDLVQNLEEEDDYLE